jgi:ADP-heptose:LPS heptosyltransferase
LPERRWIGMVPGGGTSWGPNAPLKRWGADRFFEVAEYLMEKFSCSIMIVGDAQEKELCRNLGRNLPQDRVALPDAPSLGLLAALLARCELVVGNDSGPMHLARAVGAKTVTIFGPVDPYVYGPPFEPNLHRVVLKALPCRPC